MAAWIISALALLAGPLSRGAAGLFGRSALVAGGTGLAVAEATGAIDLIPGFGGGGGLFGRGGKAPGVTRRRKKALTQTDLATALTISSAISKKAAENFILMRVRR